MSGKKNLKITDDTHGLLKNEKRDMETWDSCLRRLVRESNNDTN